MNVTVLGAGAWGTALAISVAARHPTRLWARDAAQVEAMRDSRRNARYLKDVPLPAALELTADLDAALAHARDGLIVVGTPMAALRGMLEAVVARLDAPRLFWLCKGFEAGTGRLGHEVARAVAPGARTGVLSGPSFALEVARGQPTALVAASTDAALCELAVEAFHCETLRLYTSCDPVGVEVGGAVKNVLAIATGIADGMQLGLNARAALITRGLAEMTRLGVALGARPDTFMGLSGLGDLVLTATGDLSRNRQVGLKLAQGLALPQILAELGHVAEGVYSAATVLQRAREANVEMPIAEGVLALLEGRVAPRDALRRLMAREVRAEVPGTPRA
ncbi:NAD(P)H-dependent glycerol-3-phosphate dehydrogenase [Caldimonas tepidiphila]|uniref:NAD(P)H-dependent glycerol-3-phosphate dehydrogenase n=1 Tax=Caldimonas tepidiphila TaxID=2315841 RepID=UPI000E5C3AD0|nr:NAD(P)H-dependent glycerol-3-phosphate dehydrogenase [Caldimonas tepidiphila]